MVSDYSRDSQNRTVPPCMESTETRALVNHIVSVIGSPFGGEKRFLHPCPSKLPYHHLVHVPRMLADLDGHGRSSDRSAAAPETCKTTPHKEGPKMPRETVKSSLGLSVSDEPLFAERTEKSASREENSLRLSFSFVRHYP